MSVIIGVDPHKATHTAIAIDPRESELARVRVRSTRQQVSPLLRWAGPLGQRVWAIESAGGLGYLLSQPLVSAGETVLDVPSTLASRIPVLGSGRSDKNDPNDALAVAIAALRTPALREVVAAEHSEVLRLFAKRNIDIGNHRTRVGGNAQRNPANLSGHQRTKPQVNGLNNGRQQTPDYLEAEGVGFEPTEARRPQRLSRPSHSSTLASFRPGIVAVRLSAKKASSSAVASSARTPDTTGKLWLSRGSAATL
jgi:hypothetical protein